MKTINFLLTATLVACYCFGGSVPADSPVIYDPHSVDIPTFIVQTAIAPQKVKVLVSNLQRRTTRVWLEDKNGKALFKATVRNRNGYGKTLDMSGLKPKQCCTIDKQVNRYQLKSKAAISHVKAEVRNRKAESRLG